MNNKLYGNLIFELSKTGRRGYSLPKTNYQHSTSELPEALCRAKEAELPECDELTVVRHYTNLSHNNFGVNDGFYPLGSCTMKYNPIINEEIAAMKTFAGLHPLQHADTCQHALELYYVLQESLAELTGLSEFTLNPCAGAHGELTGLMVIRAYHMSRQDERRTKVLIPDSAHGTNPASAAVCGLDVVEVKSLADGTVDVDDLKRLLADCGQEVAAMMMTNPNTLGIFEHAIPEITKLVHECGGLMYYDGANLNPMLGACRPGDMGFDVCHINLHKTFSTPHGGGGPGSGPVGVREGLEQFLPTPRVIVREDSEEGVSFHVETGDYEKSLGSVGNFFGNFGDAEGLYLHPFARTREYQDGWSAGNTQRHLHQGSAERRLRTAHRRPVQARVCVRRPEGQVHRCHHHGRREAPARLRLPCSHHLLPAALPRESDD